MAQTIDDLILGIGTDLSDLDRAFGKAGATVERFAGETGRALTSIPSPKIDTSDLLSKITKTNAVIRSMRGEAQQLADLPAPQMETGAVTADLKKLGVEATASQEAIQAVGAGANQAGKALGAATGDTQALAERASLAAAELRKMGVSEENIQKTLVRSGLIAAETAQATEALAAARERASAVPPPPPLPPPVSPPGGPSGPSGPMDPTTFRELAESLRLLQAEFKAGIIDVAQYRAGLESIRDQTLALRAQVGNLTGGELTAFNTLTSQVGANALKMGSAFQQLERDVARAGQSVRSANQQMLTAFNVAGAQAQELSRGTRDAVTGADKMSAGIANLTRQTKAADSATRRLPPGIAQTRSALVSLAVQSVQTNSALGQLGAGLLLFGAGSGVVIGAAAGLIALAKGYEILTADARKAKEEAEKHLDVLRKLREEQRNPIVVAREQTDTATQDVERLSRRLQQARLDQAQAQAEVTAGSVEAVDRLGKAQADVLKFSKALIDAESLRAAGVTNTGRVVQDVEEDRIRRLASLISLGAAQSAEVAEARDAIAAYSAELKTLTGTDEKSQARRIELQERINLLLDAQQKKLKLDTAPATEQFKALKAEIETTLARLADLRAEKAQVGATETLTLDTSAAQADVQRLQAEVERLLATATPDQRAPLLKLDAKLRAEQLTGLREQVEGVLDALDLTVEVTANPDPAVQAIRQALGIPIPVGLDSARAIQDATALRDAIGRIIGAFATETDAPAELRESFERLNAALKEAVEAPVRALIAGAETALARFDAIRQATDGLSTQTTALQGPVSALRTRYEEITAEIERQGGLEAANVELIRERTQLAQALRENEAPALFGSSFAALDETVRQFQAAQQELARAQVARDQDATKAAEEQLRILEERARRLGTIIAQSLGELHLDPGISAQVIDRIAKAFAKLGIEIKAANKAAEKLVETFDDIASVVDATGRIADNLGLIGDRGLDAVGALTDIADAGARIAAGDMLGGVLQGLEGLTSLGAALFGGSEITVERDRVLAENNERLADLAAALDQSLAGVGGLDKTGQAARFLAANEPALRAGGALSGMIDPRKVEAELAQFGLTLEDLNRIAQANGIQLLDEKGRIVAGSFEQLATAMDDTIAAATTFANTFDQQLQRETLRDQLFGTGGASAAAAEFENQMVALARVAPDLAQRFEDIDITTEAGRRKAREEYQKLFTDFELGTIDPALLAGLTGDQFLQFLEDGAGVLDQFNEGLGAATDALLNVPAVFKQAGFAADAVDPVVPPTAEPVRPIFEPGRLPSDGASIDEFLGLMGQRVGEQTLNIHPGAIVIQGAGKDADTLAEELLERFRQRAMSVFGTTDSWGQQ